MAFVKIGDHLLNTNEIINIEKIREVYNNFGDSIIGYKYKIEFRNETELYIISEKVLDDIQSDINNLE